MHMIISRWTRSTKEVWIEQTYLNVVDKFAENQTEKPSFCHVLNDSSGQTEDQNEKISTREIHNKHIGHCP
jgi:hypothetical protein